ncbi:hypothetical protein SADUNF_Sadunf10G0052900 [Salix dunnii]|uniref:Uncharacterized protein n=1 Tax=Salix dunnii TaxID=1413687 RepID=A0A835MRD4_9ROSI|nr:hypothetical protein SADUNF_Sadunf10G0052900 [Salix dunnii]
MVHHSSTLFLDGSNRNWNPVLTLNCVLIPLQVPAEDESTDQQEEQDDGVVGASARDAVKNLRGSLEGDPRDVAKFIRRIADAARESIREYLGSWRDQEKVVREICIFNVLPFGELLHSATISFLGFTCRNHMTC